MLRRLIAVAALAVGMSIAAAMTLATPAFAKGPSQASITGPGLVRAIVVSGNGEPGEQGRLANLAEQTGLFTVMFGAGASTAARRRPGCTPPRRRPPSARGTRWCIRCPASLRGQASSSGGSARTFTRVRPAGPSSIRHRASRASGGP